MGDAQEAKHYALRGVGVFLGALDRGYSFPHGPYLYFADEEEAERFADAVGSDADPAPMYHAGAWKEVLHPYIPEHLHKWKRPENYIGDTWYTHYSFLGRSRDSSCLEESNFFCGLKALGGESATVCVAREGHWLVGWVEAVRIHECDYKSLRRADKMAARIEDHPVLDESDFSAREYAATCSYWEGCSVRERLQWIQEGNKHHYNKVSIFAARHAEISQEADWLYDKIHDSVCC